jgi:hypothetical protein
MQLVGLLMMIEPNPTTTALSLLPMIISSPTEKMLSSTTSISVTPAGTALSVLVVIKTVSGEAMDERTHFSTISSLSTKLFFGASITGGPPSEVWQALSKWKNI